MTRTRRIYNNPNLKKTPRSHIDEGEYIPRGIPFTRRSWICMGMCRGCRDPEKDPRAIRNKMKSQFKFQLMYEKEMIV
ncbi:hypothetical protein GQ473_00310 [archaeon]|nr:hypothetical protein [archaeon]